MDLVVVAILGRMLSSKPCWMKNNVVASFFLFVMS
jgi:hypothetical protein